MARGQKVSDIDAISSQSQRKGSSSITNQSGTDSKISSNKDVSIKKLMPSSNQHHSHGKTSGLGSKFRTEKWVFNEDISSKKGRVYGPYESVWRDKIDTFPKPYKEITASTKPCLPSIKSSCLKVPSEPYRHGPVYTRYTSSQHRRQEAGNSIEEQIHKPVGLFNEFKDQVDPRRHKLLWMYLTVMSSKSTSREGSQKALEGLARLLERGFDDVNLDGGDQNKDETTNVNTKLNSEAITAMIVKPKNVYMYHAKPPRPVREEKAGLLPRKKKKKIKKKEEEEENPWEGPEEIRLKEVLQDYIDWVYELGGGNNIDEPTIRCLFASGYDTTPSMSVPTVLVRNADLPAGLREASAIPPPSVSQTELQKFSNSTPIKRKKETYTGKTEFRYGAWYLDPKSWKKMAKGEKLIDPKQLEVLESKTGMEMKRTELVEDLSKMHVTRAFHDFIKSKGAKQPEFLIEAIRIRKEQEAREKEKAEAEERAKQEYLLKQIK